MRLQKGLGNSLIQEMRCLFEKMAGTRRRSALKLITCFVVSMAFVFIGIYLIYFFTGQPHQIYPGEITTPVLEVTRLYFGLGLFLFGCGVIGVLACLFYFHIKVKKK